MPFMTTHDVCNLPSASSEFGTPHLVTAEPGLDASPPVMPQRVAPDVDASLSSSAPAQKDRTPRSRRSTRIPGPSELSSKAFSHSGVLRCACGGEPGVTSRGL